MAHTPRVGFGLGPACLRGPHERDRGERSRPGGKGEWAVGAAGPETERERREFFFQIPFLISFHILKPNLNTNQI